MLPFSVGAAKSLFFDRAVVLRAAERAKARGLSKFGAYVRRNAKDLLKYRAQPSAAGSPPSVHRTMTRTKTNRAGVAKTQRVSPLREFLFFAYDPARKSVVIGPAKLDRPGDAPAALEYGGTSRVERDGKTVTITVRARPYMRPAFEKAARDLPAIWRDSIKR